MSTISVAETLQQDINDLKEIILYEKYKLSKEQSQNLAKGIIANLEDHITELIETS